MCDGPTVQCNSASSADLNVLVWPCRIRWATPTAPRLAEEYLGVVSGCVCNPRFNLAATTPATRAVAEGSPSYLNLNFPCPSRVRNASTDAVAYGRFAAPFVWSVSCNGTPVSPSTAASVVENGSFVPVSSNPSSVM